MSEAATRAWIEFSRANTSPHSGQILVRQRSIFDAGWNAALKAENERMLNMVDGYGKLDAELAVVKRDLERKHEAFVIASDQAMENGNALAKAKLALDAIIERSHNDPLGTSKVNDMREIARRAREELEVK